MAAIAQKSSKYIKIPRQNWGEIVDQKPGCVASILLGSTSDCETLQTDCETSRADCATWIVKLDSRIVKLPERIVQLGL